MPLGIDLWVDFGGFGKPKSSQAGTKMGSKIDVNFVRLVFKKMHFFLRKNNGSSYPRTQARKPCFQKRYFSLGKTMVFEIQWVEVGSKNRPKIDPKMESKMECILASIFERFCRILGAKLVPSWRQVGLKNRWKIDPKRLGRFHIALGAFQETPERSGNRNY